MTEEARIVVDTIKQAFDIFSKMELPTGEQECTLSRDSAMSLIDEIESLSAQLEQVTRERDAAVEDLSAHRPCDACGYEPQEDACMRCRSYAERPYWKWRGVEVEG